MTRKIVFVLACGLFSLAPARVLACADHLYFNPDNMSAFGGAVARLAGLVPPEPVFDLEHPAMVKVDIGEPVELVVNYARPFFSKDVRLELNSTQNVRLQENVVQLDDREGVVTIPYTVVDAGFDSITLTIVGQHKGETIRQISRIYVSARKEPAQQEMQVSER